MNFESLRSVVGRCGAEALGAPTGGLAQLAKAARKAGGWFLWSTEGHIVKPVKVTAAKESPDGKAVYRDEPFPRLHLKGVHDDGRAFVVRYVDGKPDVAYLRTHDHEVTLEDGSKHQWRTDEATFESSTITKLKGYVK